jgi:integrase/recombinase XerD
MKSAKSPRNAVTVLETSTKAFVDHQRVFGRRYCSEDWILKALCRFVARHGATDLSASLFEAWSRAQRGLSPNTLRYRQRVVRKFCLFRRRVDPGCFVPDPLGFVRSRPYRRPLLLTSEHVSRLLRVADSLSPTKSCALKPAVLRLAIVLFYTAGLRRSELLRLLLSDVDANEGVLRIRESKFHRSRWVPLSSDARLEVRRYLRLRLQEPYDLRPTAALLCNSSRVWGHAGWHAFCPTWFDHAFQMLFERAGIVDLQGRRPRLHDIRHSFAVEALCRCYRDGGDVQTLLPKLALYMGHVSIVSTAHYLHFIPETAGLASERFGQHFSHLLDRGDP